MSCNCSGSATPEGKVDFQYAVKIAVGVLSGKERDAPLPPGRYDTAVNVHNPSRCDTVSFRWKVAVGLPHLRVGTVTPFFEGTLGPDEALEIDRSDILSVLTGPDGQRPPDFVKGWVVIETLAELDVVAVYGGASGPDKANRIFHTERVQPRCMTVCDDFGLDISTGVAAWTVTVPGSTAAQAPTLTSGYSAWQNVPNALWLRPGTPEVQGQYVYRLGFKLCSGFRSPALNLQMLSDNEAVVMLNGVAIGTNANTIGQGPFTVISSITASAPFHAGDNLLEVIVTNRGGPTGLALHGSLEVEQGRCPGSSLPLLPCPGVCYRLHTADFLTGSSHGWTGYGCNGAEVGTTGQSRRAEAITVVLNGAPPGTTIEYRAHLANIPGFSGPSGWTAWTPEGVDCGTTGQHRRMEAVEIRLVNAPLHCHVRYQVHMRGYGWGGWAQDGATAGTTGQNRRMEAIHVEIFS